MRRRSVLSLLGLAGAGLLASRTEAQSVGAPKPLAKTLGKTKTVQAGTWPFQPVPTPLPVSSDGLAAPQQQQHYRQLAIEDRLVVPEGFRSDLLAAWGDPLAQGRFGFNNDYLGFVPRGENEALLVVNFEYISPLPWVDGFAEVVDQPLPWQALVSALAARDGLIDASRLPADDPLLGQIRAVTDQAMADLGVGVIHLQRDGQGIWRRSVDRRERRVDGLAGWQDPAQCLQATGPATAVFAAPQRLGYDDGLGVAVVGTFANCAGGTTPWGTVLSAEENFQSQVPEAVYADGSASEPGAMPLVCRAGALAGLGNPYGLAGNKYGWMVELDPADPGSTVRKHTALGRFRHEAVAMRARAGEPLVVYSGCDRRGGHLYRFVSEGRVTRPEDPANSRLLEAGELQVARFAADGTGEWLPLLPQTSVQPFAPGRFQAAGLSCPVELPHSDRARAGAELFRDDAAVAAYARRFPTLADLYRGDGEALQGAILIDAHLAASAIGGTPTARPEDTEIDPITGDLLVAFTSGAPGSSGGADPAIFSGPRGEASWGHGWVMRLSDESSRFRWRMAVTGGEPWAGGLGFTNPDNLAIDRGGNLWIVTDRSTKSAASDQFGNNSCWFIPRLGDGESAACFAIGPMESELTGLCLDRQERALFLAVQHPGEVNGRRLAGAEEYQAHRLQDRDGGTIEQLRRVPLGSNWPSQAPGRPPRPGVVVVQRLDGQPLLGA
ncbi:phosphatase [Synechococcus sp. BS56D]|uniref:PhoX family protein n=1 Tax=Synechococcus sp. BS56D TaxID=2055944 RepID=UPI00103FDFC2|nr:alkaline phosphatase PhoX [Synechococcus sp. BS56D]TCD59460.1 phosphatase [Synechococcus sp. BS56D]